MIWIIEGKIGGGKTYYAVEYIVKYLANGGIVRTNVELHIDAIRNLLRKRHRWELQEGQLEILTDDQSIALFHRAVPKGQQGHPTFVVVDEAHLFWNTRDTFKTNREFCLFLSQSRKAFIDVCFITQDMNRIDNQVRCLAQYVWRALDLQNTRLPVVGKCWPFAQFMRNQYDQDGRTFIQREFIWKDKEIYKCYNTYQLVRKFDHLQTVQIGDGKIKRNWRKHMKFGTMILLLLLSFGWIGYRLVHNRGFFPWSKKTSSSVVQSRQIQEPVRAPAVRTVRITSCVVVGQVQWAMDINGKRYIVGRPCELGMVEGVNPWLIWGTTKEGEHWELYDEVAGNGG